MKLKAVATASMPEDFLVALDSSYVADAFREGVAVPHLHVDRASYGPATHYVQMTDLSIPTSDRAGAWGVEVTLSKVSVNDSRSGQDFKRALGAVRDIYRELIETYLYSDQECQLFVVLALDDKIKVDGMQVSLLELDPVNIRGEKHRVNAPGVKPSPEPNHGHSE